MITFRTLKEWLDTFSDDQLDKPILIESNDYQLEEIEGLRLIDEDFLEEVALNLDEDIPPEEFKLGVGDPILSIFDV